MSPNVWSARERQKGGIPTNKKKNGKLGDIHSHKTSKFSIKLYNKRAFLYREKIIIF
jgi:hypothetical protein